MYGNPWLLAVVPVILYTAVAAFYLLVPERWYTQALVRPEVASRWSTLLRLGYLTCLFTGLAWLSYLTDRPWGLYYLLLWIAPLLTTFAFLMILREEVQHGEGTDRGRFTSTRLFRGSRLIRWAVFPLGMDYHLPHHLFPLVPHYRLQALHRLLLEVKEYRNNTRVVEGYLFPRGPGAGLTPARVLMPSVTAVRFDITEDGNPLPPFQSPIPRRPLQDKGPKP
jgi:hypothetical protein